jgi:hypothetical protein
LRLDGMQRFESHRNDLLSTGPRRRASPFLVPGRIGWLRPAPAAEVESGIGRLPMMAGRDG